MLTRFRAIKWNKLSYHKSRRVERDLLTTKTEKKVMPKLKNGYIPQQSYLAPKKVSFLQNVRTEIKNNVSLYNRNCKL